MDRGAWRASMGSQRVRQDSTAKNSTEVPKPCACQGQVHALFNSLFPDLSAMPAKGESSIYVHCLKERMKECMKLKRKCMTISPYEL